MKKKRDRRRVKEEDGEKKRELGVARWRKGKEPLRWYAMGVRFRSHDENFEERPVE